MTLLDANGKPLQSVLAPAPDMPAEAKPAPRDIIRLVPCRAGAVEPLLVGQTAASARLGGVVQMDGQFRFSYAMQKVLLDCIESWGRVATGLRYATRSVQVRKPEAYPDVRKGVAPPPVWHHAPMLLGVQVYFIGPVVTLPDLMAWVKRHGWFGQKMGGAVMSEFLLEAYMRAWRAMPEGRSAAGVQPDMHAWLDPAAGLFTVDGGLFSKLREGLDVHRQLEG